jgi:glyoxylase-like metal-dependent hydrolase (beta-lactamase superfamily II)
MYFRQFFFSSRAAAAFVFAAMCMGQTFQPDVKVRGGSLPAKWITGGPNCAEVPDWQIQEYNEDLFILRESGCTDYEKPFLYLFFGKDRALLEDTGSGPAETARAVRGVMARWLLRHKRESIPLVVAHSHSHGDHIAGDAQFQTMKNVTMVPLTVAGTQEFFGIRNWPDDIGHIDLGDRVIDVIPIPGHDALSIAFYDRQTGILFTGDSLYPGRVFVRDLDAFARSNQRMVDFTRGKIVTHILGCHVEQSTTPYVDYPVGTAYQPSELPLQFSRAQLLEMNDTIAQMKGSHERIFTSEFTIWPIDAQHPFPNAVPPAAP